MPFYRQVIEKNEKEYNEIRFAIEREMNNLSELDGVNNQIIQATQSDLNGGLADLLKRGKIPKKIYLEQLRQLKVELASRQKSRKEIGQIISRNTSILSQKNQLSCFVIPENIDKKELKLLIKIAHLRRDNSKNEDEQSVLMAIIPSLETHKTMMSEAKKLPTKRIPITENEQSKLAFLDQLEGANLKTISTYLTKLSAFKNLRKEPEEKPFSRKKRQVIDTVLNPIIKETELILMRLTEPHSSSIEQLTRNYESTVSAHLNRVAKQAKEVKGLRTFINKICELLGFKPLFTPEEQIISSSAFRLFKNTPIETETTQQDANKENAPDSSNSYGLKELN